MSLCEVLFRQAADVQDCVFGNVVLLTEGFKQSSQCARSMLLQCLVGYPVCQLAEPGLVCCVLLSGLESQIIQPHSDEACHVVSVLLKLLPDLEIEEGVHKLFFLFLEGVFFLPLDRFPGVPLCRDRLDQGDFLPFRYCVYDRFDLWPVLLLVRFGALLVGFGLVGVCVVGLRLVWFGLLPLLGFGVLVESTRRLSRCSWVVAFCWAHCCWLWFCPDPIGLPGLGFLLW